MNIAIVKQERFHLYYKSLGIYVQMQLESELHFRYVKEDFINKKELQINGSNYPLYRLSSDITNNQIYPWRLSMVEVSELCIFLSDMGYPK